MWSMLSSARSASVARRSRRIVTESLESRLVMSADLITAGLPGGVDAFNLTAESANGREPASAAVTAPGKSALGGNLNMQSDRIQDHPFTNLVKTTRGFFNLAGRLASNGKPAFANTNTQGWPTESFMFSVADNSEYGVPVDAGTYKLRFTGPSTITVGVQRQVPGGGATVPSTAPVPTVQKLSFDAATNTHVYNINVPQGTLAIVLEFRNTAGSARNIEMIPPGYDLNNYPLYRNEYLNLMRNLQPNVLRLMDFTQTNNNPVSDWSQRTTPDLATQTKIGTPGDLVPQKGISWEYAIDLANALDVDIWVNVPAQANDTYITNLATMLRDRLETNLDVFVEYSNEVWNTIFTQSSFNTQQAQNEANGNPSSNLRDGGTTNPTTWAERRYARETKEIADIFRNVYQAGGRGNPLNSDVNVVLGGQYSNLGRFDNMLPWLNKFYGAPSNYLHGIGIAPYINLGGNQNVEGLTKDQVLNSLRGSVTAMRNGSGLTTAKSKANQWGLDLTAYEGGIDTFGGASIAAKRAAVLDPAIQQIVEDYLDVWYDAGGNQFNWYTLGARSFNSPNGTWSITENILDFNQPKELGYKAVRDLGRGFDTPTPTPTTYAINNVTSTEGNSGTKAFNFTITRGGDTSGTGAVNFTTSNGTTSADDYVPTSGTASFAAGETSKTVTVNVNGDTTVEANETFFVNLTAPVNGTISDNQGVGTITNDDQTTPPPGTIRIDSGRTSNFTDGAGNVWLSDRNYVGGGGNTATFAVAGTTDDALYQSRRTGNFTYNVPVANGSYSLKLHFADNNTTTNSRKFDVNVEGSQVLNDFDIVASGGGQAAISRTFPVNVTDGTVTVQFTSVVGNALLSAIEVAPTTGTPTLPSFAISDVTATEGNSGVKGFQFNITRSGDLSGTSTVTFATADQTADGTDYTGGGDTLTFAPGETTKPVTIGVKGDTTVEPNETFVINLTGATNATISDNQGVGTIQNDDAVTGPAPTLAIDSVSTLEGNSGTKNLTFTVTRSGDTAGTSRVNWATQNVTAGEGDYGVATGFVSFAAGETSKAINIVIKGDTKVENDETFRVNLSGATGADITTGIGTGTIQNDDGVSSPTPTLSIGDVSATEGNSGTKAFTFTITRSGSTTGVSTVQFTTSNQTTSADDYVPTSGTVTFAAGEASKQVTVSVNGDTTPESNENFIVTLTNATGATIGDNTGVGTIQNDDTVGTPPASLAIADVSANEGNSGNTPFSFTVTRSGDTAGAVTVNYATSNGSATSGSDYTAANGSVSFAAGETTKTVTINVLGDTTNESDETFTVTLSGAAGATVSDGVATGTIVNDDTPTGGGTGMALGGNLQFQDEFTRDRAFADLVKSSSGFNNLSGTDAPVDANGWPTISDFLLPLWGNETMDVGRYTLSFNGPDNSVVTLNGGTGTITELAPSGTQQNYVIDIPAGVGTLTLKFTGTAGQARNIKVIQPGNSPTQFWSTKYVNHLKSVDPDTIRPMDMVRANNNTTSTWEQRPKSTDATFNRAGAPWENLVDLANDLGSHIWLNIPIRATDDYVRQLASLMKTRLNSGLRVYVEVGNEVWSTITDSGKYNFDQAKLEVANNSSSNLDYDGTTNQESWAERRYARRMMQISNLFKEVWTTSFNGTTPQSNPINNRVRVILGGQATRLARFDNMLNYIDDNYGAPNSFFYGTGLAWYFTLNRYKDMEGLTKEQVLEGMGLSVTAYETEQRFRNPANQAAQWGLKLHAYELGVDTFGPQSVQAKQDATNDPRMKDLMKRFANAFVNQGGESAMWYRLGAQNYNTSSGTWGLTNDLDNKNTPKQQAFRELRGLPPIV